MKKFEPGDQAVVIRAKNEDNLGKVVTLIRSSCEQTIFVPEDNYHVNNYTNDVCWVIAGDLVAGRVIVSDIVDKVNYGVCPEAWLMPLKGDFEPDELIEEKDKELEAY